MMLTAKYPTSLSRHALPALLKVAVPMALLAGCAQMPAGPSIAVMPAPYKPFDVFRQEDDLCRGWAAYSIGIPGHDAAAERLLASTVAGAAIGALAGAAAGGDRGAGSGAAIGTVIGTAEGTNQSAVTAVGAQRRYDIAYQQCMYAKGNVLPAYVYGGYYYPPALSIDRSATTAASGALAGCMSRHHDERKSPLALSSMQPVRIP